MRHLRVQEVLQQVGRPAGRAGRDDVQADHAGQHEQAAGQAVQQELHRGVGPALAAVATDQEVDRDQRRLEQHVEQEHVGRREHADRETLQHQHPGEVRVRAPPTAVAVVPRRQDDDRSEDRGEQDEHECRCRRPRRRSAHRTRDPRWILDELEAAAGVVTGAPSRSTGRASPARCRTRPASAARRAAPRQRRNDRPDEWDEREDGQLGEARPSFIRASPPAARRDDDRTPPASTAA